MNTPVTEDQCSIKVDSFVIVSLHVLCPKWNTINIFYGKRQLIPIFHSNGHWWSLWYRYLLFVYCLGGKTWHVTYFARQKNKNLSLAMVICFQIARIGRDDGGTLIIQHSLIWGIKKNRTRVIPNLPLQWPLCRRHHQRDSIFVVAPMIILNFRS